MRSFPCVLALTLLTFAACGGEEPATDGSGDADGPVTPPLLTKYGGPTGLSCASCHVIDDAEFRQPGIAGPIVAHREAYWGGACETLDGAVTYCLQRFVLKVHPNVDTDHPGPADFPPVTEAQAGTVNDLVVEISKGPAPASPLTRRTIEFATAEEMKETASLEADAARGEGVYRTSCAVCHGEKGEGGFGHELAGMESPIDYTIDYVRRGHEEMPPFSEQALTDEQVADVARFVMGMK